MKYIDSEKLIAEIERLRNECAKSIGDGFIDGDLPKTMTSGGAAWVCEQLLSFITSLQQEQPMPDSTKLIELWNEDKEMLKEKDFRDDAWRLAYNAFLCGFGRGIAVNKQEQPEVDLEKEIEEYFKGWTETDEGIACHYQYVDLNTCRGIARHFAEWGAERQKEQMLKNAVEGEVIKTDKHTSVRYKSFYGTDRYFYGTADKQFKPGDKVRIIVLPIDELLQRQGYEHAERDLVLTIEDMKRIHTFLYAIKNNKQGCFTFTRLSDDQYKEVLRRFNELGKTRKEDTK